MNKQEFTVKNFIMNILNGVSIGIVAMLLPSAILGTISSLFMQNVPFFKLTYEMTNFVSILMPAAAGYIVGYLFKYTPIQSAAIAVASASAAGNWKFKNGAFMVKGVGDVINLLLTIAIAVLFIHFIGSHLGSFTLLLLPTLTLVVAGGIGIVMYPYVHGISVGIGDLVNFITKMQPLPMAVLMSIVFGIMVVTPISTVGIAAAIGLMGLSSGAANLGITSFGFALAAYGWSVNGLGTSLAHFLGSPKIQMANIMSNPKTLIPLSINAGITGIFAAIFDIKGTPISAGFGASGGVGPLAAYKFMHPGFGSVLILLLVFVVIPLVLALISKYLFINVLHFIKPEDFKIEVD